MPYAIQPSPEIWHRDDLPILCNWRKLSRAVEVGVDRAEWASLFLDRWQGPQWWGVDAYEPFPEQDFPREADYLTAVQRLARHAGRTKLIRLASVQAARLFKRARLTSRTSTRRMITRAWRRNCWPGSRC